MKRCSCLCTNEKENFIWTGWCDSIIKRRLFWHYFLRISFCFLFQVIFRIGKEKQKICEIERYSLINLASCSCFFSYLFSSQFSPTKPSYQRTQRWEFIIKNNLFVDFPLLHFPQRLLFFFFFPSLYSHVHTCRFKFIFHNSTRTEEKIWNLRKRKENSLNESERKKIH